mgnify:CR=1 FL=1
MTTKELVPLVTDRILCVKVGKVIRENLYEMTRMYWKLKLERASKATHVLAIVNSEVVAVYIPEKWKYTDDSAHLGRIEFTGVEDAHSEYLGKSVKSFFGKSPSPTLYINM